jgi:FKBP-type peptidyl-prolyl cis-trans isomerase SlyD
MKIDRNKHVTLTYELRVNGLDGEVIETTTAEAPLQFIFGAGKMLEMFEEKIEGLGAGESFNFELKASDAYGDLNPDAIVEIPTNIFEVNGKIDENLLKPGNSIPMQDSHGQRMDGIVLEVNDVRVKMDFNHPLAGDDLFFNGKVLEVREASEDEMAESCGGGSCGSEGGSCGCSCGC